MADPPPGPPRIVGDERSVRSDIAGIAQYLSDFYKITVLDGYWAAQDFVNNNLEALASGDPVDLENLPDPATSNIAAAQTVANAAYTIGVGRLKGDATISDTNTSIVVTLSTTQQDTTYKVTATPTAATGTPAAGAYTIVSIVKTTTQFTINVSVAPGAGNSVTFDWMLDP